jgi:hypothetical protein
VACSRVARLRAQQEQAVAVLPGAAEPVWEFLAL